MICTGGRRGQIRASPSRSFQQKCATICRGKGLVVCLCWRYQNLKDLKDPVVIKGLYAQASKARAVPVQALLIPSCVSPDYVSRYLGSYIRDSWKSGPRAVCEPSPPPPPHHPPPPLQNRQPETKATLPFGLAGHLRARLSDPREGASGRERCRPVEQTCPVLPALRLLQTQISMLLTKNQRQHRTRPSHCANYSTPCGMILRAVLG